MFRIELTEDEIQVLDEYIFKKMIRLEDAGLTDSRCFPNLQSIHIKIQREIKAQKAE